MKSKTLQKKVTKPQAQQASSGHSWIHRVFIITLIVFGACVASIVLLAFLFLYLLNGIFGLGDEAGDINEINRIGLPVPGAVPINEAHYSSEGIDNPPVYEKSYYVNGKLVSLISEARATLSSKGYIVETPVCFEYGTATNTDGKLTCSVNGNKDKYRAGIMFSVIRKQLVVPIPPDNIQRMPPNGIQGYIDKIPDTLVLQSSKRDSASVSASRR